MQTLAIVSAVLFVVTLVWHEWIEIIFKVAPDRGRGDWSGPSWLRPPQSLWPFQPVLAGRGGQRAGEHG